MSDFGTTSYHKGYKDHRCEWCGETIPAGERFAHFTGKWQDEFQNWRMHMECEVAARKDPDSLVDGFEPYAYKRGSTEEK